MIITFECVNFLYFEADLCIPCLYGMVVKSVYSDIYTKDQTFTFFCAKKYEIVPNLKIQKGPNFLFQVYGGG